MLLYRGVPLAAVLLSAVATPGLAQSLVIGVDVVPHFNRQKNVSDGCQISRIKGGLAEEMDLQLGDVILGVRYFDDDSKPRIVKTHSHRQLIQALQALKNSGGGDIFVRRKDQLFKASVFQAAAAQPDDANYQPPPPTFYGQKAKQITLESERISLEDLTP